MTMQTFTTGLACADTAKVEELGGAQTQTLSGVDVKLKNRKADSQVYDKSYVALAGIEQVPEERP